MVKASPSLLSHKFSNANHKAAMAGMPLLLPFNQIYYGS